MHGRLCGVALLFLLHSTQANAQTPPATPPPPTTTTTEPNADQRARTLFLQGREAFTRGNYEEAAQAFLEAHNLSHRPQLLYNLGTTYDRLHRWVLARDAFQLFLQELPNAPEREEVQRRLAVIQETIRREDELHQRANQGRVIRVADPPRPWRIAGIVLGGLAVVGGGLALGVGLYTNNIYQNALNTCALEPGGCDEPAITAIEGGATTVNISLVSGGVFAAASVVAFAVDLTRPRPAPATTPPATVLQSLRLQPFTQQQSSGLLLQGAF